MSGLPENIDDAIKQAEGLIALGQLEGAADIYRLALAQSPNNPECLLRLSHVLMQTQCHVEAFHHIRHFLRIVDDVAIGYLLAGILARSLGRWNESHLFLVRAVEIDPSDLYAWVMCCMSSFTICAREEDASTIAHDYDISLDGLIRNTCLDSAEKIHGAVKAIDALPPFFLPYLGRDVKKMQLKYGSWICFVMAAKYPQYAKPIEKRPTQGRIRLGIISNYFHNHSHWKIIMKGWVEVLDRTLFSLHCFHTGTISDSVTAYVRSRADFFIQSSDLDTIVASIQEQKLDIVLHSGIGMDTTTLKLAGLRLAPVQCTSWGHPVTSGLPTIDYFLSSELMEPLDGDEHYTERLIRLPNLSIYYRPTEPVAAASSAFAIPGVDHDDVMFLCCQNLLKYLPQYDHVFPDIAQRVPRARFVFIECHVDELTRLFKKRLEMAFQHTGLLADKHIVFVPPLDAPDYAKLNEMADIYLDSIGWSGGNTTLESLPFNKPIVTLPGAFMRGRHAYAILKMMDVEATIAEDVEDYVSIAVRLALDPAWRSTISGLIAQRKHKIYEDKAYIAAMERFFMQVVGRLASETHADE